MTRRRLSISPVFRASSINAKNSLVRCPGLRVGRLQKRWTKRTSARCSLSSSVVLMTFKKPEWQGEGPRRHEHAGYSRGAIGSAVLQRRPDPGRSAC